MNVIVIQVGGVRNLGCSVIDEAEYSRGRAPAATAHSEWEGAGGKPSPANVIGEL